MIPLTSQRTDLNWFRQWNSFLEKEINFDKAIHDISTFLGFYFSDTPHLGCTILITISNNENNYSCLLDKLSQFFLNNVRGINLSLQNVNEIKNFLEQRIDSKVVIADITDNPGAGANGCNVAILKNIKDIEGESLYLGIFNPEIVASALGCKIGESIYLKIADDAGNIVEATGTIILFDDGSYHYVGQYDKGCLASLGSSVVIKIGSSTIIFHSVRHQCLDLGFIEKIALDSHDFNRIIVKSSVHFRAGFSEWADYIIEVDSGGFITCDPSKLNYKYAPSLLELV